MSQKDDFQTIDPQALATVAGGTTATDDQVTQALTGILNSLQQLGQNNQQNQFGMPEMLMLMTIMRNNQQQAAPAAPPWGWGFPYYY
jgi:hypothetical protein